MDAEKLLDIDPLHESAYAGLMRAHLEHGTSVDGSAGLRALSGRALANELGSAPGPVVDQVFRQLLDAT